MAKGETVDVTTEIAASETGAAAEPQNTETTQGATQEPSPVPYARFAEVNKELKALKSAQSKAAADAETKRLADLAEQQKWQELVNELRPTAERAKKLEGVISELLKAKLDGVPEDKRVLVPDGAPEDQLAWLAKAEAAGLFGKVAAPDTHAAAGAGSGAGALSEQAAMQDEKAKTWRKYGIRVDPAKGTIYDRGR